MGTLNKAIQRRMSMTENEREQIIRDIRDGYIDEWDNLTIEELFATIEMEHKEVQKYRAIGTVEECKIAVEKMKPKEPIFYISGFRCPVCGEGRVQEWREDGVTDDYSHCPDCGQKLDWS